MVPLLPADVMVTRLSRSIRLYCKQQEPPGIPGPPRPLLLLLPWLGARQGAQAKYLQLYLASSFDVLVVESALRHFLCPPLGLGRAAQVLELLQGQKALASRPLVVHALSLGGYTFAQMLLLIHRQPGRYSTVAGRLWGHIFDSLVVGSLDRMALGECGADGHGFMIHLCPQYDRVFSSLPKVRPLILHPNPIVEQSICS